ncbi:MAG: glycosyltransferase [Flavobacteriales bacterium]|jgi:glycosyltransferase involved in cell wall biosynthesis|nr:MAG: glycosyltransferase [Flavobacteriales bacterium]
MTPRVSVIVATYNYGRYIGDALRSVQVQTLTDWECIVVDDASTDHTAEVVQAFVACDPRFRYVRLEHNSGVSVARNTGFDRARGEYLQLLDADDVIAPGKLASHVAWMDAHPEVALVYSDFRPFTGTPDLTGPGTYQPDEKLSGSGDAVLRRLLRGNFFRMNTLLLRADVVRSLGGFSTAFRHIEDWDLWLRMFAAGHTVQFLHAPSAMAGVRDSPGSLSKDRVSMRGNVLAVFRHLWNVRGLSLIIRSLLLVRYVDVLLERTFVHREAAHPGQPVDGTLPWIAGVCAVPLFPLWLVTRPFR